MSWFDAALALPLARELRLVTGSLGESGELRESGELGELDDLGDLAEFGELGGASGTKKSAFPATARALLVRRAFVGRPTRL